MKADMAELRMALRGMHDSGTGEASALLFAALDELANYRALDQPSEAFPFVPFTPKHTATCADPNCDQSCMKVTP